ncbi:MAG: hypothetical protein HYR67_05100 [Bacteroidetes bacterium]|nr:hypothetical protein [Bacteroidota bacterium]
METNKILYYTDGHEVSVTDSGFKVKKTLYQLQGITRHGFSIISPHRAPFTVLMVLGSITFLCGAMNILPTSWMRSVNILGFSLLVNSVVMIAGIVFFILGMAVMFRLKEKYAVRIFTAEGEKNVVVSQSREYISQIVDALNRAYLDLMKNRQRK